MSFLCFVLFFVVVVVVFFLFFFWLLDAFKQLFLHELLRDIFASWC